MASVWPSVEDASPNWAEMQSFGYAAQTPDPLDIAGYWQNKYVHMIDPMQQPGTFSGAPLSGITIGTGSKTSGSTKTRAARSRSTSTRGRTTTWVRGTSMPCCSPTFIIWGFLKDR